MVGGLATRLPWNTWRYTAGAGRVRIVVPRARARTHVRRELLSGREPLGVRRVLHSSEWCSTRAGTGTASTAPSTSHRRRGEMAETRSTRRRRAILIGTTHGTRGSGWSGRTLRAGQAWRGCRTSSGTNNGGIVGHRRRLVLFDHGWALFNPKVLDIRAAEDDVLVDLFRGCYLLLGLSLATLGTKGPDILKTNC